MSESASGVSLRAVDDLSLPSPSASLGTETFEFRHTRERSSSDSDLGSENYGGLDVDRTSLTIGKDETIKVSWDIKEDVTATDWIGLYPYGVTDPGAFWDSKNRGSNGGKKGEITWQLNDISHFLTQGEAKICFKYYLGSTKKCVATSPCVLLRQQAKTMNLFCSFTDMEASNLKKGMFFNPDPYIKLLMHPGRFCPRLPHHSKEIKTPIVYNSTSPKWMGQSFSMESVPTDVMEFEIKDKFAKSRPTISRFLGKASVPVQRIIEKTAERPADFDLELTRRTPSDTVSGSLHFTADAIDLINDGMARTSSSNRVSIQDELSSLTSNSETDLKGSIQQDASTKDDLEDQEDSGISLSAVMRGRVPDEVDHEFATNEEEILSCSPSNLAAIPNIKCEFHFDSDDGTVQDSVEDSPLNISHDSPKRTTVVPPSDEVLDEEERNPPSILIDEFDREDDTISSAENESLTLEAESLDTTSLDNEVRAVMSEGATAPPTLPPRTYRAPPLPPRQRTSSAPPIPPRTPDRAEKPGFPSSGTAVVQILPSPDNSKESEDHNATNSQQTRSQVSSIQPKESQIPMPQVPAPPVPVADPHIDRVNSLEPPPLPPRTYSPVNVANTTAGVCSPDKEEKDNSATSFDTLPEARVKPRRNRRSSPDEEIRDLVGRDHNGPQSDSNNSTVFSQLSQLQSIESAVDHSRTATSGSRSLECSPRVSPLSMQSSFSDSITDRRYANRKCVNASDKNYRHSDLVQSTPIRPLSDRHSRSNESCPVPPRIVPRNRILSDEEKQQNREQIVQQLQLWTQKHKDKNRGESDDESRSVISDGSVSVSIANGVGDRRNSDASVAGASGSSSHSPRTQVGLVRPTVNKGDVSKDGSDTPPQIATPRGRDLSSMDRPSSKSVVWQLRQSQSHNNSNANSSQNKDGSPSPLPKLPARRRYHKVDPTPGDQPLPPGWEARIDSHGRIFYIDHINRTTTWQKPQIGQKTMQRRPTISSEQRQQLDRRYQSIRRTINQPRTDNDNDSSSSGGQESAPQPAVQPRLPVPAHQPTPPPTPPTSDVPDNRLPAVKFLTRSDFFPLLQGNDRAMAEYNRNGTLKHMISKIRRDPVNFDRYQHNRDLVSFLNHFADTNRDLPLNWEMKFDRSGKTFFIDHNARLTTFIDPRLPADIPPINTDFLHTSLLFRNRPRTGNSESPVRNSLTSCSLSTAYNDKVVAFLKQPNISEILSEKYASYTNNTRLKEKVNKIRTEGTDALDRMCNDIDLILLLSVFENEIMSYVPQNLLQLTVSDTTQGDTPQGSPNVQRANMRVPAPYKRDFQAKLRSFYRKLESKGFGQGPSKLKLMVRRDHVLEDAFNKIMGQSKRELQKSKLYITFVGEEGLDYGGPSREFFFLLSRELFNPYYGLFEYSANDTYTVQISPMSTIVEDFHEWFRFAGRVLGLAVVHQYLLDAFFTRPFYKALLRIPWSLADVEALDNEFHQSLLWVKDNDITELDMDLTFSVNEEVFGQVTERELKPNGKVLPVNERNKKEYIERMCKWRLERGVTEQTESLIRGFHEVIDPRLISMFDARELELVIAGTVEIDVKDWRKHTEYRSGYHDQHQVIQWFWNAIEKFDNERRLRLLQFVTGTSSIPYEGFAALRGSNGPRKFCIEKWGKVTSLPRAHTCFNRLDLPPYTTSDMLFEKLVTAVEETSTFGIE
ncbi:hypothetical protein FSP39_001521 [Pinctada imbricata]|uniref:HECT-type E3 ubiquitin transferase n=1 Tax=Pinctada imbricata TaxID=66713 RepID=A0AA89CDP1_PINIB|nr:hypothetical protein FSP39_001521 [Pinctada imbricata]